MPPTYSAMNGRIRSRAAARAASSDTLAVGARSPPGAGGGEGGGDRHVDRRRDVEAVERAPGARRALLEQRAQVADVLGREEDRNPAVGDLAGQLRVLRPDRREVDRDAVLDRRDRELQRLAGAVRQRQLERL